MCECFCVCVYLSLVVEKGFPMLTIFSKETEYKGFSFYFMGYYVASGLVYLFDLSTMFLFDILDNLEQIFAQIP